MDIIKSIEHEQLKNKIPELKVGNTVKVHVRIKEGNKERIQVFEGIIIKVQGGGVNQTFTVRKTSYGVGVEKTFLVHSPLVEKVELVRVGKARRARLFYLRDRGTSRRLRLSRNTLVPSALRWCRAVSMRFRPSPKHPSRFLHSEYRQS